MTTRISNKPMTVPIFVSKLSALNDGNHSETARQIGVSSTTIQQAIKKNSIATPYEKAAEHIFNLKTEGKDIDSSPMAEDLNFIKQMIIEYFITKSVVDMTEEDFEFLQSSIRDVLRQNQGD